MTDIISTTPINNCNKSLLVCCIIKPVVVYTTLVIGRIKYYREENKKYSDWASIKCKYVFTNNTTHIDTTNYVEITLQHGSKVTFYKALLNEERSQLIQQDVTDSKNLRQYKVRHQMYNEPLSHVLLSSHVETTTEVITRRFISESANDGHATARRSPGYRYGSVRMKAMPISMVASISKLSDEISSWKNIPKWNIGVDVIKYRNGNDHVGWHSDNHQGEQMIFTTCLEFPSDGSQSHRPVCIKKMVENNKKEDGDELIELFVCAGDSYEMNGEMQSYYLHSVKKQAKDTLDSRTVLVFRHGDEVEVCEDSGKLC